MGFRFPKIRGTFSGGPTNMEYNLDYKSLGSILGPPYVGKIPFEARGSHNPCLCLNFRHVSAHEPKTIRILRKSYGGLGPNYNAPRLSIGHPLKNHKLDNPSNGR